MPEAKKKKGEREGEEREKDGKSHVSLVSGRKKTRTKYGCMSFFNLLMLNNDL